MANKVNKQGLQHHHASLYISNDSLCCIPLLIMHPYIAPHNHVSYSDSSHLVSIVQMVKEDVIIILPSKFAQRSGYLITLLCSIKLIFPLYPLAATPLNLSSFLNLSTILCTSFPASLFLNLILATVFAPHTPSTLPTSLLELNHITNLFFPNTSLFFHVYGTTYPPILNPPHSLESLNIICPDLEYDLLLSMVLHYSCCSKHEPSGYMSILSFP